MLGITYELSIDEWCAFLDLPYDPSHNRIVADVTDLRPIASSIGLCHDQLIVNIHNPCIRYFIYFLSSVVFARDKMHHVSQVELFLVEITLCPSAHRDTIGAMIAYHFSKQSHQHHGAITCGGLITHIATHLGVDMLNFPPLVGYQLLDIRFLNHAFVISESREGHHYFLVPLPIIYLHL